MIVIGRCVREVVAEKSGLLSGLSQAAGIASLPVNISAEDVHRWHTARLLDVVPSTDDLVTVLKVADVLGDTDQAAWENLLTQRVVETDWADGPAADAMLCALLTLPLHLLQRHLSACVRRWENLALVLKDLPLALHQPLIAALAEDGDIKITAPLRAAHDPFLVSLAAAAGPPRGGLRWFQIAKPSGTDKALERIPPVRAALLARSLAAHPSLQQVHLRRALLEPPALARFAACLPGGALPNLVNLTINTSQHPGGCVALSDCVRRLSSLTHLYIAMHSAPAAEALALDCLGRAASSPAPLPHLKVLQFDEYTSGHETRGQGGAGRAQPPGSTAAASFLRLISAPELTFLLFQTRAQSMSFRSFWSALATLPSLKAVSIKGCPQDDPSACLCASALQDNLPALKTAAVHSMCPGAPLRTAAAAARSAPGLTSLRINSKGPNGAVSLSPDEVRDAWAALLPAMARHTCLQHLELGALTGLHLEERTLGGGPDLAAALAPLTALTYLRLGGVLNSSRCRLHGRALGAALRELRQLRVLWICNGRGRLEVDEPQHMLGACTRMSQLSWLGLCMHAPEVQLAEALAPLRALRKVTTGGSVAAQGGTEALQARFPDVDFAPCDCSESVRWS